MPPPVYSVNLAAGGGPTPFSHTRTVPPGFVWDVKNISVYLQNINLAELSLQVGSTASGIIARFWAPANSEISHEWHGRLIIPAGDQLLVLSDGGGDQINYSVDGFQLSTP